MPNDRLARVQLRRARPDEAGDLTALAMRSKASWGYDEAFMERVEPEMAVTLEMFSDSRIVVALDTGEMLGYYRLQLRGADEAYLNDLFVAPSAIGTGIGRLLFESAVADARDAGSRALVFESDPNAEPFYLHLGATRTGRNQSPSDPKRLLPVMQYILRPK
ncbi:MAG: GNAT family N-acetyltransferase [Candidatus Eremiobacteraeota bacterium]|nr:GNAT family N-acetyltransferase [Candidatus Eremiobacteraeota bacterium]